MKKVIFPLTIFICFFLSAKAQQHRDNLINPSKVFSSKSNKNDVFSESKTIAHLWDTLTTYNATNAFYELHTRTFDITGNFLNRTIKRWNGSNWQDYRRNKFTYDVNGNTLTDTLSGWDYFLSWVNVAVSSYTYDTNGNMLTWLKQEWQGVTLVNINKITYTYDTNNNETMQINQVWQGGVWGNSVKISSTYDLSGNLVSALMQTWHSSSWENSNLQTYTYDTNGNILVWLSREWTTYWNNFARNTFTYDINGYRITQLDEVWNGGSWQNSTRQTFTNNIDGQVLVQFYEIYSASAWWNYFRRTFSYDFSGNLLTYITENWQSTYWLSSSLHTYTYNSENNSITGKYEEMGLNWEPANGFVYVYSDEIEDYYLSITYRYEANYISLITGTENLVPENDFIQVFPSPAGDNINIILELSDKDLNETICIYDLQGRLMIQQTVLENKICMDISILNNGIYILKITGNHNGVKKIIKGN